MGEFGGPGRRIWGGVGGSGQFGMVSEGFGGSFGEGFGGGHSGDLSDLKSLESPGDNLIDYRIDYLIDNLGELTGKLSGAPSEFTPQGPPVPRKPSRTPLLRVNSPETRCKKA